MNGMMESDALVCANAHKSYSAVHDVLFDSAEGMQTPVSLVPRSRVQGLAGTNLAAEALVLEPSSQLYHEMLDCNEDITIGRFAGAIALMWLTPWDQLQNLLSESKNIPIKLNLSECFLRYTKYLVHTARIPSQLLIVALLYIMRFRHSCKMPFVGAATSEARILVTALLTADKYEDDISYTTATWAKLGKLDVGDLKKMEMEFLKGISFQLSVSAEEWRAFTRFLKTKLFPLIDNLAPMA